MKFDCPEDCGGCSCHMNAPCSHCVDHYVEEAPPMSSDEMKRQLKIHYSRKKYSVKRADNGTLWKKHLQEEADLAKALIDWCEFIHKS